MTIFTAMFRFFTGEYDTDAKILKKIQQIKFNNKLKGAIYHDQVGLHQ